jgi:hypothetical protein
MTEVQQQVAAECRSDEAGAPGDEDPHGVSRNRDGVASIIR